MYGQMGPTPQQTLIVSGLVGGAIALIMLLWVTLFGKRRNQMICGIIPWWIEKQWWPKVKMFFEMIWWGYVVEYVGNAIWFWIRRSIYGAKCFKQRAIEQIYFWMWRQKSWLQWFMSYIWRRIKFFMKEWRNE